MSEQMSKDQQIGFHKGAADTLVKEKTELLKMVNIVDQILQGHVNALKQLGEEFNVPELVQAPPKQETKEELEEEKEEEFEDKDWQG